MAFPNGVWPFVLLFREGRFVPELEIKSTVSLISFLRKLKKTKLKLVTRVI